MIAIIIKHPWHDEYLDGDDNAGVVAAAAVAALDFFSLLMSDIGAVAFVQPCDLILCPTA
jgi:hypothetical protein